MRTLDSMNLAGKRVLLRIDLNSSISGNRVLDNPRFKEHADTIKELIKRKAIIVILAHQGRPREKDFISLRQHSKILNKYVKVKFVDDIIGKKALNEIEKLKIGETLLLENVRFLKEEFNNIKDNNFIKLFSKRFDYYCNDAFSLMHRNETSITGFPKIMPSFIGPVALKELNALEKIKSKIKNALFILGGNKPKEVSLLIKNNKVLSTGILSLLALKSLGIKLGKEDELLKNEKEIVNEIKKHNKTISFPKDIALNINGKRKEIFLNELPSNYEIWDIGKETVKEYAKEIKKAKIIFFKGSAGMAQHDDFSYGTKELLKEILKSKAFSVIAGGSSSEAIERFKLNKNKFGHISLSGGALVYYLAGKKLPGLEVLK